MKRIIAVAALLAAASSFAAGQTPDKPTKPAAEQAAPAGVEQELTRLSEQYVAALKGGDAAALERIWADDLTFVNSAGAVQTKKQRLDDIRSGANKFDTLDPSEQTWRVYGDAAVGTSLSTIKGQYGGQEVSGRFRVTQTYVRRGGAWQIVAIQMTRAGQP
jgi:ketosteroid isomerase-like protein